jgi:hypothetical protein
LRSPGRARQNASLVSAILGHMFPVSRGEVLHDDFSCSIEGNLLQQGRLYVCESHLYFYSDIFGRELKVRACAPLLALLLSVGFVCGRGHVAPSHALRRVVCRRGVTVAPVVFLGEQLAVPMASITMVQKVKRFLWQGVRLQHAAASKPVMFSSFASGSRDRCYDLIMELLRRQGFAATVDEAHGGGEEAVLDSPPNGASVAAPSSAGEFRGRAKTASASLQAGRQAAVVVSPPDVPVTELGPAALPATAFGDAAGADGVAVADTVMLGVHLGGADELYGSVPQDFWKSARAEVRPGPLHACD